MKYTHRESHSIDVTPKMRDTSLKKCHPALIFKIKQIKMKSWLVRQSPFPGTQC